jgi:hypothetical protein
MDHMKETKSNESETSLGADSGGVSGTESDTAEHLAGADGESTSAASANAITASQSHAPAAKPVIYAWMKKVHINNSGLYISFLDILKH